MTINTGTDVAPEIKVKLPGPKAAAIIARDKKVITTAYTRGYPFVLDYGKGCHAWDVDGNKFIDFVSGIAVNALGHAHPEIVRVVQEQASRFFHMAGTDFYYEIMEKFATKLCSIAPGAEKQCFMTNSGAESIEAAIKLARFSTRRPKMIAFYDAFHGRTMGALSLSASKAIQKKHYAPLLDVSHAPYGDLDFIDNHLFTKTTPPEDVAAIFVEPIQGEGGYNVPPKGFLAGLRERCDRHGILLVMDEVQAGLGRTGKMWACDHDGVDPDILCLAKPVGGGIPLGVILGRKELMENWPSGSHANTFGGNPLACAAGLRTIEILEEEGLVENCRKMGEHLVARLEDLAKNDNTLGPVHGLGLMQAIDIRTSDGNWDPARRDAIVQAAFEQGLLIIGCGKGAIRFLPPLNVKQEEIDAALAVFADAIRTCPTN